MLTHPRTIPSLLVLIAAVFAVWMRDPMLDLRLSQPFFDDGAFIGARAGILQTLRGIFWDASLIAPLIALLAVSLGRRHAWPQRALPMRDWNIILWGFLLGPGLLVNGILKAHSGRARPYDVLQFGGDKTYTPIGQIADQCAADCSFVSGEVAGTTALCIALLILLNAHARSKSQLRLGQGAVAAIFGFVFWQRIASGGHFAADAILAALFTGLVMAILARTLPQPAQP